MTDLPLVRHERIWGPLDFTWVNVGLGIATWGFLFGGSTAAFVGAKEGIAAILIGNLIGTAIVALAVCIPPTKYGLEQYMSWSSAFGPTGARAIVWGIIALTEVGWAVVLAIMFGRASTNAANSVFGTEAGPNSGLVVAFSLFAIVISWIILVRGPVYIKWFNRIVAPGLIVVTVLMLVLIFSQRSWGDLLAAEPVSPFDNHLLNFVMAVEFNVAGGLGWLPIIGNLSRLATTQRVAVWSTMIGCCGAYSLTCIVGLLAALSLGSSDPTVWMIPLGGAVVGVLVLVFIALANITSVVSIVYSTCIALRCAGGEAFEKVSWTLLTGAFFVIPAIVVFFPAAIYDNFFKFVVVITVVSAPLAGIIFADFFFLRRREFDLRGFFVPKSRSPYSFWSGVNPAAFVALIAGSVVYVLLLNPYSLESAGLFRFLLGASIPSVVVGGGVHYLLTKLVVLPRGKGGYVRPGSSAHAREDE